MIYDTCIIGAGIAGLFCARELIRKNPKSKICILEKYTTIGGRTYTFKDTVDGKPIQWEAGAGRIHKSHHQTLALLKEYGLETIPIQEGLEWRTHCGSEPIEFGQYIENFAALNNLSQTTLRTHTLKDLLNLTLGRTKTQTMLHRYEYNSELDTLRADKSLEVLSHELGSQSGFSIVKDGFSALVGAMKREIEKAGVKILRGHEVTNIQDDYTIHVKGKPDIKVTRIFVAIPRDSLAMLPCFKSLPIIHQVKMRPLVRIYAVFPTINGKAWFDGIKKFVCDAPVRFVIPMDPTKGTIMISYTDGEDAEYWMNRQKKSGEAGVMKEIMQQIRSLFPNKPIHDPIYTKIHAWSDGCSYWLPGDYDFDKVSKASVRPLDSMRNLYMCSESWAYNQCWVECAIDQARHALNAADAN
jgi:monoamine oxidase